MSVRVEAGTAGESGAAVDPVTLEIIQGALEAAIREMEALVDRTAMSAGIKEKKDRFIGMYDARGRMITAHLAGTGPGLLDALLEVYPRETMRPGDMYWFNDPYLTKGGIQHLGDMCFVAPVFGDGQLAAFAATFGHFRDIGGARPGSISPSATEIFQEGTRIPPILIVRDGQMNQEVYRLILANSRFPLDLEGDTKAMIASSRLGEARLRELFDRFGVEAVVAAFDQLIDSTASAARALMLKLIPEGRYSFYDYVDSDGLGSAPIRVGMDLIREGDRIIVDLSNSDPQTRGPVNFISTIGAIRLMFGRVLMTHDEGLLLNEGLFQIIDELRSRPGTVIQASYPAATGLRSHARQRISSCMLGVFARATGGQSFANSPVYIPYVLVLRDPKTGTIDVCSEGVGGGLGARPYADGVDVIYYIGQQNFPIEFIEQEHAIQIEQYEIEPDSGGPGYYRGGCGVRRDVRILQPGIVRTRMDNCVFPCWGVNGGLAGRPGAYIINPGTPRERIAPLIGDDTPVEAGDLLRIVTIGGGGWGDPFTRPAERVREDVLRRFVTVEGARRDYGVVLDPNTKELDVEATAWLRAQPRPARGMFDRGIATEWLRQRGESLD